MVCMLGNFSFGPKVAKALYVGYNYFALVHHLQHHRGKDLAGVAYLPRLERLHALYHHRQVVNFGISTTIWDRLFGTFEPTNEPSDGLLG